MKSIATDNGSEFAGHEWITEKPDVPMFFTDSYCAWQKDAVENGNKLIRQYTHPKRNRYQNCHERENLEDQKESQCTPLQSS